MKIQFLISSLSGGGAEKVLSILAKSFAQDENDVSILTLDKRPQFYQIDGRVSVIHANHTKLGKIRENWQDFLTIRKYVRDNGKGVTISFLSRCNMLTLLAAFGTKRKVIVCDRNNPLKEHSKLVFWLSCQLYRRADGIFVQTEKIRSFYPSYLQKKITVIENPVDFNMLQKQVNNEKLQREKIIVSMGRLEPQKDFVTLIRAFAKVSNKMDGWKLKIYGIGEMQQELQNEIEKQGLQGRAILCGRTERPFYDMSKGSIFVLSSYYEGFPNVLCEAMYAMLPCVSSDCVSGPSELIEQGENGYLFEIGDVDFLANKLLELGSDEHMRKQLGYAAHKTVERLSVEKIYLKWVAAVLRVMEELK